MRREYYLLPEAVADAVTRNLVTIAAKKMNISFRASHDISDVRSPVHILHVAVICPLVTHIESGGDGTPVGVLPAWMEDVLVQPLVEVIDTVVKGEHHWKWAVCFAPLIWFRARRGNERHVTAGDEGGEFGSRRMCNELAIDAPSKALQREVHDFCRSIANNLSKPKASMHEEAAEAT